MTVNAIKSKGIVGQENPTKKWVLQSKMYAFKEKANIKWRLSKEFWIETVKVACHLVVRSPLTIIDIKLQKR